MKFNPAFLDEETLVRSFVVRKRELEAVMEIVRENTGAVNQHVLVIGPRGIGKTTLVLRVAAETRRDPDLAARWYPVVYGEESYGVTNAGEFWLEALFQIGEQTGEARWKVAHEDLSGERDAERLERRALTQLMDFADERDRRLLLVVENLNMLVGSQLADDDAWRIRHTLLNEPRLMLLGTATRRFEGIDNEGKALYDLFRVVDLQPLDTLADIGAVWTLATKEEPRPAYLRPVEILTGGNPRLIRILSEFAARTSFRELMENLVHLVDDHTEYFKHHLDALAPQERKVFVALADRWDPGTARDIAEVTRLDVSTVSTMLGRLESRGAVAVRKQKGRTKVYQVAERLYNIYHLMRRRGQASARVRAAVRFMVHIYEGDALIPLMGRLVDEACDLTPEHRREHYLAYSEVLDLAGPKLRNRIVAETRARFESLPDVPSDLRERLEAESPDPYASSTIEDLMLVDVQSISSLTALKRLVRALLTGVPPQNDEHILLAALRAIDRVLTLDPDDAWAWYNRGVALAALGRYEEALEASDRALALDPDDARAWYIRGLISFQMGRYEDTLDALQRALTLDPGNTRFRINRGEALSELGQSHDALNDLSTVLQTPVEPDLSTDLTDLVISLSAQAHTAPVLQMLTRSPVMEAVEPLIVALRMDLGEEVEVAQEIEEVARDILARIHAKRGGVPRAS